MSARAIYIIQDSGVCFLQQQFSNESKRDSDEALIGGLIAAIFSFSKSFSTGIESLSLGDMILYYAVGENIIVCLGVEKKVKAVVAQAAARKIHEEFVREFSGKIAKGGPRESNEFLSFPTKLRGILLDLKLISKWEPVVPSTDPEESSKVASIVRGILNGDDPSQVAKKLKEMFETVSDQKFGKELRRVLIDLDRFIVKLALDEKIKRQILALTGEIRSYAAIDEWLG